MKYLLDPDQVRAPSDPRFAVKFGKMVKYQDKALNEARQFHTPQSLEMSRSARSLISSRSVYRLWPFVWRYSG